MKRKLGKEEGKLVLKKINEMRAQVSSGKKKMYSIEEISKEAGVHICIRSMNRSVTG